MKLVIDKTEEFKNIIYSISELIDECNLKIDQNGLYISTPDSNMICLVNLELKPEYFSTFNIDGNHKIGVNLNNLLEILKKSNKEKLEITQNDNKLILTFLDKNRSFTLPILDISEVEQPPIEEFEFKTKIKINSEDLDIAIKDSKAITDSLIFNCPDTNSFVFEADGETSSYKLPIKPLEYHISEPLKSKYPLLYLEKIIKAKKEFDTVILNFNKDYPCKFEFIKNGIVLSFILAPRVTEE